MKKKSSVVSLLLLSALLLSTAAACGGETAQTPAATDAATDAATQPAETEEQIKDNLPALDFGGAEVKIHGFSGQEIGYEITSETGDIIEDTIYRRNRGIEERLNVKLVPMVYGGWENYNAILTTLKSEIMAGDSTHDIVAGWSARVPSLSAENLLLNLNDVQYLDKTQPWWNQTLANDLDIGGNMYFMTGDIALTMLTHIYGMFYNKNLAASYDMPDLVQTVKDGKWNLDLFYDYTKDVYTDLNGDGKSGPEDLFGVAITTTTNVSDSFLISSDIQIMSSDGSCWYEYKPDVERIVTLLEKVNRLTFDTDGCINMQETGDAYKTLTGMFANDQVLFMPMQLAFIRSYGLNDMKSDFGILPYPKLDDNQKDYHAYVQNGFTIWGIPTTAKDPNMSGAVMEAMASEGLRTVTPMYYETAMKIKYARDGETSQMLDLLKDSVRLDFGIVYNESIGNPYFIMRELHKKGASNVASTLEKKAKSYQKALDKLHGIFEENR